MWDGRQRRPSQRSIRHHAPRLERDRHWHAAPVRRKFRCRWHGQDYRRARPIQSLPKIFLLGRWPHPIGQLLFHWSRQSRLPNLNRPVRHHFCVSLLSRRRQWRDCIQGRHYPLQPTVGNSSTWYGHSAAPGSDSLLAQCPCFQLCLWRGDRKSTRLNSSHQIISYAVFCLKKKKSNNRIHSTLINETRSTTPKLSLHHIYFLINYHTLPLSINVLA